MAKCSSIKSVTAPDSMKAVSELRCNKMEARDWGLTELILAGFNSDDPQIVELCLLGTVHSTVAWATVIQMFAQKCQFLSFGHRCVHLSCISSGENVLGRRVG